jgi:hypothetical protein
MTTGFSLDIGPNVTTLMNTLIPSNSDIVYANEQLQGDPRCAALFDNAWQALNGEEAEFPPSGFVLGTGEAINLYMQNSTQTTTVFGSPGDPELAALVSNDTVLEESYDACTLKFDFMCETSGFLRLDYSFASDEYKEVIISPHRVGFADAFAILLNGENIATVPEDESAGSAVSVYTVNHLVNEDYFVYNNPRQSITPYPDFEPDGFTKKLKAEGEIVSGWNTMKIGIVDIKDTHVDSWVFIEEGSFECVPGPLSDPPIDENPEPDTPDEEDPPIPGGESGGGE